MAYRTLLWRVLFSIACSMVSVTVVHGAAFSDVSGDDAQSTAITYLHDAGIVVGYTDGTFKPEQNINRAEWLKMLYTGLQLAMTTEETGGFFDVPQEAWFADYVDSAASVGIANGYADGFFRPDQTVNYVESLKMLLMAGDVELIQPTTNPAVDVAFDSWFAPYVATALGKNVIEVGVSAMIDPSKEMTRGETSELLYRLLKSRENDGVYALGELWETVDFPSVFTSVKVPDGWQQIIEENQVVLWGQDTTNHQVSYVRTTEDSGVVVIAHDNNSEGLSETAYFDTVRTAASTDAVITEETHWGNASCISVKTPHDTSTTVDLYSYLDDGTVVILYGTYGDGVVGAQRGRKIDQIFLSFRPIEGTDDSRSQEEILASARANIAIDGKGTETLGWFSDKIVLSTDAIGVGTGPIDYYYSASFNITLKYERSFDVILDIAEGQTDAF